MDQQLELFKEYSVKVRGIVGPERAATILAESLYIICVGSDDIANTYFPTPLRRTMYDPPSYANLLVGYASQFIQVVEGKKKKQNFFDSLELRLYL